MNQKLFDFLSANGFTPTMSDYEEIRTIMSLNHCTLTERKFLDEIREKFVVCIDGSGIGCISNESHLSNIDFQGIPIKELVNEQ